jgi:nicotinamidase-related amidase
MDAFSNNKLDRFLVDNKINSLYITGLDAEACVDKTVKAALNRGYKVTIIKDAIAAKSDEKLKNKIEEFSKLGADISTTEELLKKAI